MPTCWVTRALSRAGHTESDPPMWMSGEAPHLENGAMAVCGPGDVRQVVVHGVVFHLERGQDHNHSFLRCWQQEREPERTELEESEESDGESDGEREATPAARTARGMARHSQGRETPEPASGEKTDQMGAGERLAPSGALGSTLPGDGSRPEREEGWVSRRSRAAGRTWTTLRPRRCRGGRRRSGRRRPGSRPGRPSGHRGRRCLPRRPARLTDSRGRRC